MNATPQKIRTENGGATDLIGLDLGTSALKGVLMSQAGTVLHAAERQVTYSRPRPGRVELDAGQHWREVTALVRELAAASPAGVRALAFCAASGNTLLADENAGPLAPVINWMDRRCAEEPPPLLRHFQRRQVHRISGWPCVETFPLAHLAWLRTHRPELLDRAKQVGMNTDWLLQRLTGRRLMDHSTATTFILQDQLRRRWHRPYLRRLGIAEEKLAELTVSGTPAGPLEPGAAGACGLSVQTEAVTGCFDHPAAARGAGVLEPGRLLLSCGTSWVGFLPHDDRDLLLEAGLLCDPFLSAGGGPWGGIFSIPCIGETIEWYIDNLIAPGRSDRFGVFNELAAESEPGAGGLAIDLRRPPRPIEAHRRHIARAVMEGAAGLLAEKIRSLGPLGRGFRSAVLAGGPSKSPLWPSIIAEKTGLDLSVASAHAGARGAALLAGIGAGVYEDEQRAAKKTSPATVPPPKTLSPTPSDAKTYREELSGFLPRAIFDVHVHLFDSSCLRPGAQLPPRSCYRKFGGHFTLKQYLGWASRWLPEQTIHLNSFGTPSTETDRDLSAAYTGKISDNERRFGMALVSPKDPLESVRKRIEANRLVGMKPYLRFVDWKPPGEVTIEDMLTEKQLDYADQRGLAVMLHIPRAGRLSDPLNLKQMPALCRRYPNVQFIFAHIGRAYYLKNVIGSLQCIADIPNAYIDTAMVNHEGVLEYAFRHFPVPRILFGSDAPIALLRGKSVEINNQYAYLMAEDYEVGTAIHDPRTTVEFTSFYYEQLRAIKLAADRAALTKKQIEKIFHQNAAKLFKKIQKTLIRSRKP